MERTSLSTRLRAVRDLLVGTADASETAGGRPSLPIYLLRLGLQIAHQWADDKCPQAAASLAYETALSLVPLIAVAFALLEATGAFNERSTLMSFLAEQALPISHAELAAKLTTFAEHIGVGALGVTGVVSMLVLAYLLFHTIEGIFNDIWHVQRRRSLASKLVVFYALATIVPFLLGVSLVRTLPIWGASRISRFAIPGLATIGALTLNNKLLPACTVRWRPALAGGIVSGVALEVAKEAFRLYVAHIAFARYSGVYGPLGLVALFLVWIYLCWVLVLFGAEVAHAVQNLRHLERRRRFDLVSAPVGARVLLLLAGDVRAGALPSTAESLGERLDAHGSTVAEVLDLLRRRGIVKRRHGRWALARPASGVTLHDVLDAFRPPALHRGGGDGAAAERLERLLDEIRDDERTRSQGVTLEDLLVGGEVAGSPTPPSAAPASAASPSPESLTTARSDCDSSSA